MTIKILVLGPNNVGKTCFIDSFFGNPVDWNKKKTSKLNYVMDNYYFGDLEICEFMENRQFHHERYDIGLILLDFSKDIIEIQNDLNNALDQCKHMNQGYTLVCVGIKADSIQQKEVAFKKDDLVDEYQISEAINRFKLQDILLTNVQSMLASEKQLRGITTDIPLYFINTKDTPGVQQIVKEAIKLFLYYPLSKFIHDYKSHPPIPRTGIYSIFSDVYPEKNLDNAPPQDWNTVITWAQEGDKKTKVVLNEAGINWRDLSSTLIDSNEPRDLIRKSEYFPQNVEAELR